MGFIDTFNKVGNPMSPMVDWKVDWVTDDCGLYLPLWKIQGTGSTIYSLDKNRRAGTVNGSLWVPMKGWILDGIDDVFNFGNLGAQPSKGMLAMWIYATAMENYRNPFSTGATAIGSRTGIRFEENATGKFICDLADDAEQATLHNYLATGMLANTWYHVVLIWDSTKNWVIGLLNGEVKFSEANTTWAATMPNVRIGVGYQLIAARYWKGIIDDVRLYNYTNGSTVLKAQLDYLATKGRHV